jgi:hypothetical protein
VWKDATKWFNRNNWHEAARNRSDWRMKTGKAMV